MCNGMLRGNQACAGILCGRHAQGGRSPQARGILRGRHAWVAASSSRQLQPTLPAPAGSLRSRQALPCEALLLCAAGRPCSAQPAVCATRRPSQQRNWPIFAARAGPIFNTPDREGAMHNAQATPLAVPTARCAVMIRTAPRARLRCLCVGSSFISFPL